MHEPGGQKHGGSRLWLYSWLTIIVLLIVASGWTGWWLAEHTVPMPGGNIDANAFPKKEDGAPLAKTASYIPPVYFYPSISARGDWRVSQEEAGMAVKAGIHRYVLPVPLPWGNEPEAIQCAVERVGTLAGIDADAQVMLSIQIDPPDAWRALHPEDVIFVSGQPQPYASPASTAWRTDVCTGLDALRAGLSESGMMPRIEGILLTAYEEGRWRQPAGPDTSPVNAAGFQQWLTRRYGSDESLRAVWGDESASLSTAAVPEPLDDTSTKQVFFALPKMQPLADYRQYLAEQTADALAAIASHIKSVSQGGLKVIAPYGFILEPERNTTGHCGMLKILDSDLDAFAGPISVADRGLGGAGGPSGPVDSLTLRGKTWFVIDDTRTGIARNPDTGQFERHKGLLMEDVYSVQQRNFGSALVHGLGVFWVDPEGEGRLHDPEMWDHLGKMRAVYEKLGAEWEGKELNGPLPGQTPKTTLAVVVDEASRFYQQCGENANAVLLAQARDCALRAGVCTRFYLLRDVIEERAPAANAYLFLNAFVLDAPSRNRLHDVLARQKAAALWLYAPGYIDGKASADNISATVRMKVKAFDGPAVSGSSYRLSGEWINVDEAIGATMDWGPLFYTDDENTDVIAQYRDSKKPSITIAFLEEGWSSIYFAEPSLTPEILREVLHMLELPSCCKPNMGKSFSVVHSGRNLICLHAKEAGERIIELGTTGFWDVNDLFVPEMGWPLKQNFRLPMKAGETRLLQCKPVETLPAE